MILNQKTFGPAGRKKKQKKVIPKRHTFAFAADALDDRHTGAVTDASGLQIFALVSAERDLLGHDHATFLGEQTFLAFAVTKLTVSLVAFHGDHHVVVATSSAERLAFGLGIRCGTC